MERKTERKIRVSFLALALCFLTSFAYATGPETFVGEAAPDSQVPTVPALELKSPSGSVLPQSAANVAGALQQEVYSLSLKDSPVQTFETTTFAPIGKTDPRSGGLTLNKVSPVFVGQSNGEEVNALVDAVLSRMAEGGLGSDLSEALAYIGKGDYEGFLEFLKENPVILNDLISVLDEIGREAHMKKNFSWDNADSWLRDAYRLKAYLVAWRSGGSDPSDPLETVKRLYAPIASRIAEVTQSLETASRVPEDLGKREPSSGDLLRNFSGKAREFILNSFNQAQANLANGMLSNPLEATAFAAETTTVQASSKAPAQVGIREMTVTEIYGKSRSYQVVDSVYIGKEFIYAQKMLHPPANLHPYLKWLLYTRNLTPRMMENYLATREAVGVIYDQAKAGRGNIRYRDKVYGAFLPFAETAAGNYELVKPASSK